MTAFLASLDPVVAAVLSLMVVAAAGLGLASIRIRGIGVGVAGVLFAGILAGHFGVRIEPAILHFVRDFGLILFVFVIGLQMGPGFLASFREHGLRLNGLAVLVVLLGGAITLGLVAWCGIDSTAVLGLFAGATTNTPALGAAQQMLRTLDTPADPALPALAYAVAYPGGVLGIIAALLCFRVVYRRGAAGGVAAEAAPAAREPLRRMHLCVENANLENLPLGRVPGQADVVVSRIRKRGQSEVRAATERTRLSVGDVLLAVGTPGALEAFRLAVGCEVDEDLRRDPGPVLSQKVMVTRRHVLGKTLDALALDDRYGVAITRIVRGGIEMSAAQFLPLKFGDAVVVVGREEDVAGVAAALGNREQALHETKFAPIFVGIALGVLLGLIPLHVPHLAVPVRLGLAGGPLIAAIVLSRLGRVGPLVWYMPADAGAAFRELGIVLFLACVGLAAGEHFFDTVFSPLGARWLVAGLAITLVPLAVAGVLARVWLKLPYATLGGVLAGSMTDPPALAFVHALTRSEAPLVAYATVYPLTMLLRMLAAQLLALWFCG